VLISQLNEVTQKQAVYIQSLIQENSKLNTKLLPEITVKKKRVALLVIKNLSLLIKRQSIASTIDTIKYLFMLLSV
jgi:hypothetical protein